MANTRLGRNTRIKVEGGRGTCDIKNRPHNRTSSRSKYDAGIIVPAWMTVAYAKSRSKHTHWVICRNVLLHVSREYNKIKEKKRINYATQVSYDREIPIEMYLPCQQSICLSGLCHREQTRRRNANEEARANPERIKTGEQGTLSPWPQQRLSVKAGSPSRGGSSSYQTLVISFGFRELSELRILCRRKARLQSLWLGVSGRQLRVIFQNRLRASGEAGIGREGHGNSSSRQQQL